MEQVARWRPPEQLLQVGFPLQGVVQGLPHAQALQPVELQERLDLILCSVPIVPAGGAY